MRQLHRKRVEHATAKLLFSLTKLRYSQSGVFWKLLRIVPLFAIKTAYGLFYILVFKFGLSIEVREAKFYRMR